MSTDLAIRCIGASHLLQPPLTALLARQLKLAPAFTSLPPLPALVAHNMAFASVSLPTCAGVILAFTAGDVVDRGAAWYLAWLMAAFWTWRLARQGLLRRHLPGSWHWGLTAIFSVQGPVLAALLLWSR